MRTIVESTSASHITTLGRIGRSRDGVSINCEGGHERAVTCNIERELGVGRNSLAVHRPTCEGVTLIGRGGQGYLRVANVAAVGCRSSIHRIRRDSHRTAVVRIGRDRDIVVNVIPLCIEHDVVGRHCGRNRLVPADELEALLLRICIGRNIGTVGQCLHMQLRVAVHVGDRVLVGREGCHECAVLRHIERELGIGRNRLAVHRPAREGVTLVGRGGQGYLRVANVTAVGLCSTGHRIRRDGCSTTVVRICRDSHVVVNVVPLCVEHDVVGRHRGRNRLVPADELEALLLRIRIGRHIGTVGQCLHMQLRVAVHVGDGVLVGREGGHKRAVFRYIERELGIGGNRLAVHRPTREGVARISRSSQGHLRVVLVLASTGHRTALGRVGGNRDGQRVDPEDGADIHIAGRHREGVVGHINGFNCRGVGLCHLPLAEVVACSRSCRQRDGFVRNCLRFVSGDGTILHIAIHIHHVRTDRIAVVGGRNLLISNFNTSNASVTSCSSNGKFNRVGTSCPNTQTLYCFIIRTNNSIYLNRTITTTKGKCYARNRICRCNSNRITAIATYCCSRSIIFRSIISV